MNKIVSGGQTGADRAGLDWAIANAISHGGWCPKGRKALDGPLEAKYELQETPSGAYPQRTEWNVRDSDGTVVFTLAEVASGGSQKTITLATQHKKPCLHLHAAIEDPSALLKEFVAANEIQKLNVAGSRESKEPGLYAWVFAVLTRAFGRPDDASEPKP